MIDSMRKSREEGIKTLVDWLHETRDAFFMSTRGCNFECRSMAHGALSLQMQSSNLLSPKPEIPFQNLTYSILVERILAFKSPQWYMLNSSSRYYSGYDTSPHLCYNASFSLIFATLDKSLDGSKLQDFPSR